jgi:serine/threonine protein kinase/WD40 repeat protein
MIGKTLGQYLVLDKLGEGGMGEVYRARDTRLGREVAIKTLPPEFTADPERRARFEREARLLAALNHPNIAAIYGFETFDDTHALVLELVAGETLEKRISTPRHRSGQGSGLPLSDALVIARQIADALDAAHEKGIIHRDLKPANIQITPEGTVKVLDFGVGKLALPLDVASSATTASSIELDGTRHGWIVGTAAYMSPEQARGQAVDKRTDIWSFGCVLYEMLTGRAPFQRDTLSETLVAILDREPDWPQLPSGVVPGVRRLLRRCLEKDPRSRLRDIADVRFAIEDSVQDAEQTTTTPAVINRSRRLWFAVGSILLATALVAAWWIGRRTVGPTPAGGDNPLANAQFTRFTDLPGSEWDASISPDGRFVVFLSDSAGRADVWLSQVGTGRFTNLTQGRETTGDLFVRNIGISHDGSEIWLAGRFPDRRLRRMPLIGGPSSNFLPEHTVNLAWSRDGARLAYHTGEPGDPMFVADRNGGSPRKIFINPRPGGHNHFPIWSDDGQWIYFVTGVIDTQEMDLWRIRPSGESPERLTQHDNDVSYPTLIDSRMILYLSPAEDGSGPWLWRLDTERKITRRVSYGLEKYTSLSASADGRRLVATVSNPAASLWTVPILDRAAAESDAKPFAVPTVRALAPRFAGGALFYLSSLGTGDGLWRLQDTQLLEIWKGRDGPLLAAAAISSDGKRVAISFRAAGKIRLNVLNEDGTGLTPLAESLDVRGSVSWSPDGTWIAAGGYDAGSEGLFKVPVGGGTPVRLASGRASDPVWSPDGSLIVYSGAIVAAHAPLLAVRADGTPVEMPPIRLRRGGERYRFLSDGKSLVYMQGDFTWQDFWLLDLTTMKSRPLTKLTDTSAMRTFDITRDDKHIIFDRARDNSDIVLVDLSR